MRLRAHARVAEFKRHGASPGEPSTVRQVVDMFGCGLPVCAAAYACIGELVSHGDSGLLFSGPAQLAAQLTDLLGGFPEAESLALARMRHTVGAAAAVTWDTSWRAVVLPMFRA